ncbi:hypothetical protein [Shimia aestuarii]|nr:hypothetical protein [Shimia aestuarii]
MYRPRPLLWLLTVLVDRDRLPELMHLVDEEDLARSWHTDDIDRMADRAPPLDLLREIEAGGIALTGMPQSDPLQRRDIPLEHLTNGSWNWLRSRISVPAIGYAWIAVEVSVADEPSASERKQLRIADMKSWLDRHPHWFEPSGDGKFQRTAGPTEIFNALRGSRLWGDAGLKTVQAMIHGTGSHQDAGLHKVDPRVVKKAGG